MLNHHLRASELFALGLCAWTVTFAVACGDDDGGGTAADRIGVGAACSANADCPQLTDTNIVLECLTEFTGGYCGLKDCTADADCPDGSLCVTQGASNYCFRACLDKSECNYNRTPDNESNCSANVTFVEPKSGAKACVPPSSGTP